MAIPHPVQYQGSNSRYLSGINFEDFVLALDELNRKGISFAVSYDGKRGNKTFGNELPKELNLKKIDLEAGRSSQATLLSRDEVTSPNIWITLKIYPMILFKFVT